VVASAWEVGVVTIPKSLLYQIRRSKIAAKEEDIEVVPQIHFPVIPRDE